MSLDTTVFSTTSADQHVQLRKSWIPPQAARQALINTSSFTSAGDNHTQLQPTATVKHNHNDNSSHNTTIPRYVRLARRLQRVELF